MNTSSRRGFLSAGLAAPAAFAATSQPSAAPLAAQSAPKDAKIKLDYRTLGKTGLKVTTVAFGTMITSDPTVIEKAADIGINHFDTARGYQSGNCEKMVGAALKGKRKDLILSTKSHTRSKEGMLQDLDTSLAALGTDWVDIWYIHAIGNSSEITDDLLEAQRIAKKAGKIRFSGLSTHAGHKDVISAVAKNPHFDVLLTTYSFAMNKAEMDPLLAETAKAGIGIVAMKVMAGGQRRTRSGGQNEKTREILQRDGAALAALKWVISNKNVHTTIPSITDMDQLDENLRAMAGPFTPSDGKILEARLRDIQGDICRFCGSCSGSCPQGLPVADLVRFAMYADYYGQFSLGRERFLELAEDVRMVKCADCSGCVVSCPNGVRIADRLIRAQELYA